jgi:hypothetical protein
VIQWFQRFQRFTPPHNRTVLSSAPEASVVPSGEKATLSTGAMYPSSVRPGQHLERDDPVQLDIARPVDDGEAAAADLFEDFVFAEAL